jgi:cyanophycin synthetase
LGPNRSSDREGATVEVRLDGVDAGRLDSVADAWSTHAHTLMAHFGWRGQVGTAYWIDESPAARHHVSIQADGPVDALMALTELLEQAWVLTEGELLEGTPRDVTAALAHVRAVAEREAAPAFAAAHASAVERGLITTFDDDSLSIGAGRFGHTWSRLEVPPIGAIPWSTLGNIPLALVTGSNGKTTVTRWLAQMLREAGHVVGMSTTDGVFVDDELLDGGDYSGPAGARMALRDARISAAALETARGGILRRGLAVHHADAACVTNLSMDHFGEYGIDSVQSLGVAKLTVARAVHGAGCLVLPAGDAVLREFAPMLGARPMWVTLDGNDSFVTAHARSGGNAAMLLDDVLLLHHGRRWHELAEVRDVPATLGGAARHNIANALFAASLAAALGTPIDAIQRGLSSFGTNPADLAGRFVRMEIGGATVIVDYAHNPAAVEALIASTAALPAKRRAIAIGTGGNREDDAIRAMARATIANATFDRIVAKDMPRYRRGRAAGEMPAIMIGELQREGVPHERLAVALSDQDAATDLLTWMRPGDLVLLTVHTDREAILAQLESLRASSWTAGTPLSPPPS